jgi:hypothetical protein
MNHVENYRKNNEDEHGNLIKTTKKKRNHLQGDGSDDGESSDGSFDKQLQ